MDFEVQRCTRQCAKTEKPLEPGEVFFSALKADGADVRRYDYSIEAWEGPPDDALGWWKSQMPSPNSKRTHWAPNDVMLRLFEQLELEAHQEEAHQEDMRYILALLMLRRRVVRLDCTETDEQGREILIVSVSRDSTSHRVTVTLPSPPRTQEIQEELAKLLW